MKRPFCYQKIETYGLLMGKERVYHPTRLMGMLFTVVVETVSCKLLVVDNAGDHAVMILVFLLRFLK